jgi:hypothetical protein
MSCAWKKAIIRLIRTSRGVVILIEDAVH